MTASPLGQLRVLASQEVEIGPGVRHLEVYTRSGLLSVVWHGDPEARAAVLMGGGAMGGTLGPAGGIYHDLGTTLAAEGIGTLRVGYRLPGHLESCVHDMAAAAELAAGRGAERFVSVGHSFGGAVAIGVAVALDGDDDDHDQPVLGVVTLSTQSAGCEIAGRLGGRPLLLVHGDADEILPVMCSEMVRTMAGSGELVVYPGTGHLLKEAGAELRTLLGAWIPRTLEQA
jgi:pimeloyl-ACP methyl ester carboxylesterase